MKNEYKGKLWKPWAEVNLDVVGGYAAEYKKGLKVKKKLTEKHKEIYNLGGMLVEFLSEKVYNTDIFKFV